MLASVEKQAYQVIIGIEGGSTARHALLFNILETYKNLYEVNPLYTKQRRTFGTKGDKSDKEDAKLIAEILTKKLKYLSRIIPQELGTYMLSLKKRVWYHEETSVHGARLKNQLHKLRREENLSINQEEKRFLQLLIAEKEAELTAVKKTRQPEIKYCLLRCGTLTNKVESESQDLLRKKDCSGQNQTASLSSSDEEPSHSGLYNATIWRRIQSVKGKEISLNTNAIIL